MQLKNDRSVVISVGHSRKDTNWQRLKTTVGELWDRIAVPVRGTETVEQYFALKKPQRDELKDIGGFVGGELNGGRRKATAVIGRDLVTLDFDTIKAYGTEDVLKAVQAIGCGYAVYSTRKHIPTAPRLRVVFPLDRTVTADEYEPIARWLAKQIGIEMADPTTFEASRLMYWASACSNSEFVFDYSDAPFASADLILSTYLDWHDVAEWPQVPGEGAKFRGLATRQGDPMAKAGIVGAFNRAYGDVLTAAEAFLPGVYTVVDNDPHRLTYAGGSTTGGAVLYEDGKFLYSHHATDPCSNKLVNCFDLIRLHKFGHLDDDVKDGTPSNRYPSYEAMCEFAANDPKTKKLLIEERMAQAKSDFQDVAKKPQGGDGAQTDEGATKSKPENTDWMMELEVDKNAIPKKTIANVLLILSNDHAVCDHVYFSELYNMIRVEGALPWNPEDKPRAWADADISGLYWYLETAYGMSVSKINTDAAFDVFIRSQSRHEVREYLRDLQWDGAPRLDTLFIDYLGAEDDAEGYTRAVCRKAFVAAVARAMEPGCKYDSMVILCGPQGVGKSTLIDKMSRGWFNDAIRTFEGKEAAELLNGAWLVEIAELDAFRRSEVSLIKGFLTQRFDRYRAAYGRNVKEIPRACVFFGTCNYMDFLSDTTGNRRFLPIDVSVRDHEKTVWKDLTDDVINQIWAEAKVRWSLGEDLVLTGKIEETAKRMQELHREESPRESAIRDFINKKVPADWSKWSVDRRRDYWAVGERTGGYELVERDRICAREVWCELFLGQVRDLKASDIREINNVIRRTEGWDDNARAIKDGPYNTVKGFTRKSFFEVGNVLN